MEVKPKTSKIGDLLSLSKQIFNPREESLKEIKESNPPLGNLKLHSQQKSTMKKKSLINSNNFQLLLTNSSINRLTIMQVGSKYKTMDKKRKIILRSVTSAALTMKILPLILLISTIGRTVLCSLLVGSVNKSLKFHRWLTIWQTNARTKISMFTVITAKAYSLKKTTTVINASGPSPLVLWNVPSALPQYFLTARLAGKSTLSRISAHQTKDCLPDHLLHSLDLLKTLFSLYYFKF